MYIEAKIKNKEIHTLAKSLQAIITNAPRFASTLTVSSPIPAIKSKINK